MKQLFIPRYVHRHTPSSRASTQATFNRAFQRRFAGGRAGPGDWEVAVEMWVAVGHAASDCHLPPLGASGLYCLPLRVVVQNLGRRPVGGGGSNGW